jgi:CDP-glucose 4,6-dehydratase
LWGQAFNFSTETQVTVRQLVEQIVAAMDSDLEPIIKADATNEIKNQYLSARKARELLKWSPSYSLAGSMLETVAWYREYFAATGRRVARAA